MALGALLVGRILAVDVVPVITNDSVGYLTHALEPFSDGLVWVGYRQVGYQAVLATERLVSGVMGIEPLLFIAVAQRALLIIGGLYAVWLFRWWSIPLLAVITFPRVVAYSNFILTEGIAVPLSLLVGLALVHVLMLGRLDRWTWLTSRAHDPPGRFRLSQRQSRVLLVIAAALLMLLVLIKYQSGALVLPFAAVMYLTAQRQGERRFVITLGSVFLLALVFVSLGMSMENRSEYDDALPISRGLRNAYWGTYQLVFNLHPETRQNSEVADLYADGNTFAFIRHVESEFAGYPEQRREFEEAIDRLLGAAGLDRRREQLRATWGALRGGRHDDIAAIVDRIVEGPGSGVHSLIRSSGIVRERGDAVFARYNREAPVEAVLTSALVPSWLRRAVVDRPFTIVGPVALALVIVGAVVDKGDRLFFLATASSVLVSAAFLGYLLVDNHRYVLAALVFVLPAATLALMVTGKWLQTVRISGLSHTE
jgi:hypothetical protein